jgi:flavin reductase (DIM6/NTAB) family NADH-FMN oxidoreductase RutF
MTTRTDQLPLSPAAGFAREDLRAICGRFATGITVVTAGQDVPRGMTANSFTSVSLDPPLVLVCVLRTAVMHEAILGCESFAVSVLSAHQEKAARYFADRSRPRGDQEFAVVDSTPGPCTGAPILSGALAWLECRLAAVYDGGDHSIFLAEVLDLGRGVSDDALLFYGGGFHRLEPGMDR